MEISDTGVLHPSDSDRGISIPALPSGKAWMGKFQKQGYLGWGSPSMWTHSPPHRSSGTSVSYIWIVWFKLPFCHGFNKYLLSSAISLGTPWNTNSCSPSSGRFCAPLPRILFLCLANPSGSVKVTFFFLWNYILLLLDQQPAPTPPISHFSVIVGDICFMYSEDVY